jgi:hypothetical protein
VRYTIPDLSSDPALTRFFRWEPGSVQFTALRGHHTPSSFPPASVISQYQYLDNPSMGHAVPAAGRENFRFNLWLNGGATAPASGQPVEVVINDFTFNEAGFTITPLSGLVTTESGGQAAFTVQLNTVPASDVTITLTSSDATEGTVSPATLVFTPADALTPRTVTITGVNDAVVDGNVSYTILTTPATSSDPSYSGLDPDDVRVMNTEALSCVVVPRPVVQPRGIVAQLVMVKERKKRILKVVVRYADTLERIAEFRSSFQKPRYKSVTVSTRDSNGNGAADIVVLAGILRPRKQKFAEFTFLLADTKVVQIQALSCQ